MSLYKCLSCLCSCKDRALSSTSATLEEKKILVFGLIISDIRMMSLIRSILIVVYCSVLYLILDSTWIWYSLLLELKIPTLV